MCESGPPTLESAAPPFRRKPINSENTSSGTAAEEKGQQSEATEQRGTGLGNDTDVGIDLGDRCIKSTEGFVLNPDVVEVRHLIGGKREGDLVICRIGGNSRRPIDRIRT